MVNPEAGTLDFPSFGTVYSRAMKLLLKNLRNGQIRFEALLAPEDLELEPGEFEPGIRAVLDVRRGDRWLRFDTRLSLRCPSVCDRCAIEFERVLEPGFVLLAHEGESLPAGADPDEVHLIKPEDEILDLGPDFRDEILIAREQPSICKENCLGLCAGCGRDLNLETCSCGEPESGLSPFDVLAGRKT